MPAYKGAFGVIEIGAAPAVIGEVRGWRQANEANEIDTTVMGSGNARMQPGSMRNGIEADLFFDWADAGQALIWTDLGGETPVAVSLYPQGNTQALPVWTANCYVMQSNVEAAADGAIEMTATFSTDENGGAWGVVA